MSLRLRLILSVLGVLVASLVLGGWLIAWRAARSVEVEMRASLGVRAQVIVAMAPQRGGEQSLTDLVASFNGDRHIKVSLLDAGGAEILSSTLAQPASTAPAWFAALVGVEPETLSMPAPASSRVGASLRLQTDPKNEIGEVWGETRDSVAVLALFCLLSFALIHWLVGSALQPLAALGTAFAKLGAGRYDTRVAPAGPPELAQAAAGFNHMAERLEAAEASNRRLSEQMARLQDEERAELARDLHDEVGPFLFAVNVDAAAIPKLAEQGKGAELEERVGAIRAAVAHMQRQVRALLGQLRPLPALELGLAAALDSVIAPWRQRTDIELSLTVDLPGESLGETLDGVLFRLVQEGVSNAVRHGRPRHVEVRIQAAGDQVQVSIADDGAGLPASPGGGYGLPGMRERVAALGGELSLANRTDGPGVVLRARLPLAKRARVA